MATRRHSTVFEVLTAVTTAVQSAEYSPHEVTGRWPWLNDQVLPPETFDEYVTVVQAVEDGSSIAWERVSPGGRDESVLIEVVVGTSVRGRTRVQVLERLWELCDVVQAIYYNPTTYVFTPPDITGAVELGGFSGVSTIVDASTEGHVGQATLRYQFVARI